MSTPSSTINICSGVKLNKDYKHSIWFSTQEDQENYFAGKVVKTFSAYSYLRKNWSIKVGATLESARKWSYLFFKNGSGKTYYYFITDVQYINDNTVEIFLEMDVLQTYYFVMTRHRCFVERQHVRDDAIGNHTVEEGLEMGEVITKNMDALSLSNLCVLVMATYDPMNTGEENTDTVIAAKYNGVFSGLGIYAVNMSDWQAWGAKLMLLNDKLDGIVTMWMYPQSLVELEDGESWTDGNVTKRVKGVGEKFKEIARNTTLADGYSPRNKKLLCYPYNFLYVENNSGNSGIFRYERFGDPSACNFRCVGALSPDGSVVCYPLNYHGEQQAFEYGIPLGGFPTCAWNQDVYKLWLAQNQNQQNLSLALAGVSIAGGVASAFATGGVGAVMGLGGAVSGATQIASILAQRKDMSVTPPQAKGNHSASVNVANSFHNFTMKQKCVTSEQAKILDDYFDIYGYKLNRQQVPSIHARENWTYVKTIDCHVTGDFCNEDQLKIQSIFDNGITWWTNGDNIGNYSLSNGTL